MASGAYPDGIGERHMRAGAPFPRRLRWAMIVVLGAILASAVAGVFGGHPNQTVAAAGPEAALRVNAPTVLRNGEFFEMRFAIEAKRTLAKPAVAVAERYWRGVTINTMVPAPASERFEDGFFVFEFDPLAAGETLEFKADGQINPSLAGSTAGAVEARDDKRRLARVALTLRVFP